MVLRAVVCALAVAAAGWVAVPAAASAVPVGIVDVSAKNLTDSMNSTLWAGGPSNFNVSRVRTVAPWDVALRSPLDPTRAKFDTWVNTAKAKGMEPYVTFWMGVGDERRKVCAPQSPDTWRCVLPRLHQYTTAVRSFVETYPTVKLIGAWNEPNFHKKDGTGLRFYTPDGVTPLWATSCKSSNPRHCGSALAARYLRILASICANPKYACKPIAGEFTSRTGPKAGAYVEGYKEHLGTYRPNTWAIHPYQDVRDFQEKGYRSTDTLDFILSHLGGSFATGVDGQTSEVWMSAVGALYRRAGGLTRDESQKRGMTFIMRMAANSDLADTGRLTRLYVYNFLRRGDPQQDRALTAGGQPRSAYFVVCNRSTDYNDSRRTCPALTAKRRVTPARAVRGA